MSTVDYSAPGLSFLEQFIVQNPSQVDDDLVNRWQTIFSLLTNGRIVPASLIRVSKIWKLVDLDDIRIDRILASPDFEDLCTWVARNKPPFVTTLALITAARILALESPR